MKKLLLSFLVLLSVSSIVFSASTLVLPYFTSGFPGDHVGAGMTFDTSSTLRNADGSIISGTTALCSGSSVNLTPSVRSVWTPLGPAQVTYPECYPYGYCPIIVPTGAGSSNIQTNWISSPYFNDLLSFASSAGFATGTANDSRLSPTGDPRATGITAFGNLGTFSTQPVTYILTDGSVYPNSESGMNLFCKGYLEVLVDGAIVATRPMPVSSSIPITIPSTSGSTSTVTTRLAHVDCMAVVAKHPLDLDHPSFFRLYFFPGGRPTFSSSGAGSTSTTVPVSSSGGMCSFTTGRTNISATTRTDGSAIMQVVIPVTNSGDSLQVSTVSSSDSLALSASPFPEGSACAMLYGSLCPTDNGFGTTIARGATLPIYVLAVPGPVLTSSVTLTVSGQTTSSSCDGSGGATCSQPITVPTGRGTLSSCSVSTVPPTSGAVTLGARENAEFSVTCQDVFGTTIHCPSGTWSWSSNVDGTIVSTSGSNVIGRVGTLSPGLTGSITYSSGGVSCSRAITTRGQPLFDCTFDPTSARLNTTESQHFNLTCVNTDTSRTATPTTNPNYRTTGLDGALSNRTPTDVDFTAGRTPSSGRLEATVPLTDPTRPYIRDVEAVPAQITVVIPPPRMCVLDTDCPIGQVCVGGICIARCTVDTDCPTGQVCLDGRCITPCPTGTVRITNPDGSTTCRACPDPSIVCPTGSVPLCLADGRTICQCNPGTIVCPPGFIAECTSGGAPRCIRPPGGDDDDGSTDFCTIGVRGQSITLQNGTSRFFSIRCGPGGTSSCGTITWSVSGSGAVISSSNNGATIQAIGPVDSTGQINAFVGGDSTHSCSKVFTISPQLACVRVS